MGRGQGRNMARCVEELSIRVKVLEGIDLGDQVVGVPGPVAVRSEG